MAKFDGVLFVTDYDDTLYDLTLSVSEENRAAIRYFIENGGRFSIATGRAYTTFTPQIEKEHLLFNAPVVLSNGAAIYDYQAERYIERTLLHEDAPARLLELCRRFPDLAFEAYHGDDIYVHNPNLVTMTHLDRVGSPYTACPIPDMPVPWNKIIMEQEESYLKGVQTELLSRWGEDFEAIFSNRYLLEVTRKGSNKGTMVAKVAALLGIARENLYCMGTIRTTSPCWPCPPSPSPRPTARKR